MYRTKMIYYNYKGIEWERAQPFEMATLNTSRIYLMIYLIDITNIDKICY